MYKIFVGGNVGQGMIKGRKLQKVRIVEYSYSSNL